MKASSWRILSDEQGFTLVELEVAVVITSVLGGLLFITYIFAAQWLATWKRDVVLQNNAHVMMDRLATDLSFADQIITENDSSWTLIKWTDQPVTYRYENNRLVRNGVVMNDSSVVVSGFRLEISTDHTLHATRLNDRTGEDEQSLIRVKIAALFGNGERTIAQSTSVAVRPSRPWNVLVDTGIP